MASMLRAGGAFLLATAACGSTAAEYAYEPPRPLDDGWRVSTLEAEGMSTDLVTRLTNQVISGKLQGIHSILIVKNGAIVHEVYFKTYHRESLHTMYSITKSVTSGLVGIAIDQGFIDGVDETIGSLLPEYAMSIKDEQLKGVTIQQLLTMSSGLEWDEWSFEYCDPRNSEYDQVRSADWVQHVLELPVSDQPGSRWVYNTGGVHVLSAIIRNRTGLNADRFAEEHLFEPLGIKRYQWNADPKGYPCTGGTRGGLKLRVRDIAKFGMLFMREGRWNGRQVISEDWVRESTASQATTARNTEYGYLWWRGRPTIRGRQIEMVYGSGYGGQMVALVPELDLMYVLTSWGQSKDADTLGPMVMILNAALNE